MCCLLDLALHNNCFHQCSKAMSLTIGFLGDLHYIFLLVLNTFIYLKLEIAYHYQKEFVNCLIYYPEDFGLPVPNDILLKFVVSSSETSDII